MDFALAEARRKNLYLAIGFEDFWNNAKDVYVLEHINGIYS